MRIRARTPARPAGTARREPVAAPPSSGMEIISAIRAAASGRTRCRLASGAGEAEYPLGHDLSHDLACPGIDGRHDAGPELFLDGGVERGTLGFAAQHGLAAEDVEQVPVGPLRGL